MAIGALLLGCAILLWIGFNYLVEMQPEVAGKSPFEALHKAGFAIFLIVYGVNGIFHPVEYLLKREFKDPKK